MPVLMEHCSSGDNSENAGSVEIPGIRTALDLEQVQSRCIETSSKSLLTWVHPLRFHMTNIVDACGAARLLALQSLKDEIHNFLIVPSEGLSPEVSSSFLRTISPLMDVLIGALCGDSQSAQMSSLQCIQSLFQLAIHLKKRNDALSQFMDAVIVHGLSDQASSEIRRACCRYLHLFFLPEAFSSVDNITCLKLPFENLLAATMKLQMCSKVSTAASRTAFCNLLKHINPLITRPILSNWKISSLELYKQAKQWGCNDVQRIEQETSFNVDSSQFSEPSQNLVPEAKMPDKNLGITEENWDKSFPSCVTEDSDVLLWKRYELTFEDASFLIDRLQYDTLFGSLTTLCDRSQGGPNNCDLRSAYQIAVSLTQSALSLTESNCNKLFQRVLVMSESQHPGQEDQLLLKSKQLDVICAIFQLFILDSNFNVVILGANSFTRIIDAISKQCIVSVAKRELCNLTLPNGLHNADGFTWVWYLARIFLRVTLADPKLVVRIEGSRLAEALTRFPDGEMNLIRTFTAPLLVGNLPASRTVPSKSRLRQEAIDIVTISLLHIPRLQFDLQEICDKIIMPGLLDKKQAVKEAALDCLSVVAHLLGDSHLQPLYNVIEAAEAHLLSKDNDDSGINKSNGRCKNKDKKGRGSEHAKNGTANVLSGEFAVREPNSSDPQLGTSLVAARARILERCLPKEDSQGRIVRVSPSSNIFLGNSNANMSVMDASTRGEIDFEGSAITERRKPSAGRLRGNARLPWDPRDSAVSLTGSSIAGGPCSLPNLTGTLITSSLDVGTGRIVDTSTGARQRLRQNDSSLRGFEVDASLSTAANPELCDVFDMDSLSDHARLCRSTQFDHPTESFPLVNSQSRSFAPLSRTLSGSINILPTSISEAREVSLAARRLDDVDFLTMSPLRPIATALGESTEVSGIRSKASKRRALRVFADAECSSAQLGGRESQAHELTASTLPRPSTKQNGTPAMPSLSTGRMGFHSTGGVSFPKNRDYEAVIVGRSTGYGSCRLNVNADSLQASSERRPVRGQHDLSPGQNAEKPQNQFHAKAHQGSHSPLKHSQSPVRPIDVIGKSVYGDRKSCEVDNLTIRTRETSNNDTTEFDGSALSPEEFNTRWSLDSPQKSTLDDQDPSALVDCYDSLRRKHEGDGDYSTDSLKHMDGPVPSVADCEFKNLYFREEDECRDPPPPPPRSSRFPTKSRGRRTPMHSLEGSRTRYSCPNTPKRCDPSKKTFQDEGTLSRSPKCSANLSNALSLIASSDWEEKVNGLVVLSDFILQNPNAFTSSESNMKLQPAESVSQVILAVTSECKNLRSQVSRQAVRTLASLFRGLGRAMDPHIETCVRVLLGKAGEASAAFLRGEVAVALDDLTRNANPTRALLALLQHGIGHKNAAIRRQCAIQVCYITERLGAVRLLQAASSAGRGGAANISSWGSMTAIGSSTASIASSSTQAIAERIISALGQFLSDSNQETRYYGRRILVILQQNAEFDRLVTRYLTGQPLRALREAIDYLNTKGLGEPPTLAASASGARSAESTSVSLLPRGSSAGNLGAGSGTL